MASDGFDREDPRTVATPNTNGAWTDLGSDDNDNELVTDGGERQSQQIAHWATVSVSTIGMVALVGLSVKIDGIAWAIPLALAAAFPFAVMAVRDAIWGGKTGDSNE